MGDVLTEQQRNEPIASKNAVPDGNPYLDFFGPPNHQIEVNPRDTYEQQRLLLPEAYHGRSQHIRDVLEDLFHVANEFLTREILPLKQTNQLEVDWTTLEFTRGLAVETPYEGVARLLKQSESRNNARLVRRGVAIEFNHDFALTPEGRKNYTQRLQQLVRTVRDTASLEAMSALLGAKRYDKEWHRKFGRTLVSVLDRVREEASQFGMVQKDMRGLEVLISRYKALMQQYGSVPNSIILPQGTAMYLNMAAPLELTRYSDAGPEGPSRYRKEDRLASIMGVDVYESHALNIYADEPALDLLSRHRQVGEYYLMKDPTKDLLDVPYESNHRSIMIFDELSDRFEKISLIEALENSFRFSDDGSLHPAHNDLEDGPPPGDKEAVDVFMFRREDGRHEVAKWFGLMEKENLTVPTMKKVIRTTLAKFKADSWADIQSAYDILAGGSAVPALVAGPALPPYADGLAGYQTWWGLIKASETSAANREVFVKAVKAVRALFRHLAARFPRSELLKGENCPEYLKPYLEKSEWPFATLFENVVPEEPNVPFYYAKNDSSTPPQPNIGGPVVQDPGTLSSAEVHAYVSEQVPTLEALWKKISKLPAASNPFASREYFNVGLYNALQATGADALTSDFAKLPADVLAKAITDAAKAAGNAGTANAPDTSTGAVTDGTLNYKHFLTPVVVTGTVFDSEKNWVPAEVMTGYKTSTTEINTPLQLARSYKAAAEDPDAEPIASHYVEDDYGWSSSRSRGRVDIEDELLGHSEIGARFTGFTAGDSNRRKSARGGRAAEYVQPFSGRHNILQPNVLARLNVLENMPPIERAVGRVFILSEIHFDSFAAMINENVTCPINILLTRPMAEYVMGSAVLCKKGSDTGETLIGFQDAMLNNDAAQKKHFLHYTFQLKAIVTQPKNVVIMEDIKFQQYVAGYDTEFLTERQIDDIRQAHEAQDSRGSLLPFVIPYDEVKIPHVLDIRGYESINGVNQSLYSAAAYYRTRLNLGAIYNASDVNRDDAFRSEEALVNTVCLPGSMQFWTGCGFDGVVPSASHLGDSYPGVAKVRSGKVAAWNKLEIRQTA